MLTAGPAGRDGATDVWRGSLLQFEGYTQWPSADWHGVLRLSR